MNNLMPGDTAQAPDNIYIARQPILDKDLKVQAYELLYREGSNNNASFSDGDSATSQVIVNAFMEIGFNQLIDNKIGFINLTSGFLTKQFPIPFPKDKIVLEILEDIPVTTELLAAAKILVSQGYVLALDDFEYDKLKDPLIELCQIIKIDILETKLENVPKLVKTLRPFNKILLAEKVETEEEFKLCLELGFKYFQGYYFSHPKIIKKPTISANKMAILQLLSKLSDPDTEFDELEEIISHDSGISYKLLRMINSVHFNLPKNVQSLRQALIILGNKEIKNWATLLAFSGDEHLQKNLVNMSLIRAKMCRSIAEKTGHEAPDVFFTLGMFSMMDVILQIEMSSLLKLLPFSDEFNNAILKREGILGEAVACLQHCENGEWEKTGFRSLSISQINEMYLDAILWSHNISSYLDSGNQ